MTYIIDLPEETVSEIARRGTFLNPRDKERLQSAINNIKPLDGVLQKILLEIADIGGYEDRYSMLHDRPSLVKKVRNDCLEIIDKHIKEYTE